MFIHSTLTSSAPALGYGPGTLQKPCLAPGLWAPTLRGAGRCFSLQAGTGVWGLECGEGGLPGALAHCDNANDQE